jgi:hypothetical protein
LATKALRTARWCARTVVVASAASTGRGRWLRCGRGLRARPQRRSVHVHCHHRRRAVPAGAVGGRASDAARLPGWLPRLHTRRLHVGFTPVHRVVLAARSAPVRRAPGRHRVLRPRFRGARQGAGDGARRLCTVVGFYRYAEQEGRDRALAGRAHPPPAADRLRVPRRAPGSRRARRDLGGRWPFIAEITPWSRCWRQTGCGCPKRSAPISKLSAKNGGASPSPWCGRAARSPPCRSPHGSPGRLISPSANARTARSSSTAKLNVWTATPQAGSFVASPDALASASGRPANAARRVHHRRPGRWGPAP